ncbi:carbohydrate ABC transporter permease [Halopelagius longus]|uniref:Carbohydrate ABC transporter membrane protein 1, CUT1 family n=1 Tax=Halopelagius longus TaxID=1236180 RepID=A0A1H1G2P9_9EURY|nr:sugar ABC transporter permease [Halopelagius longus]RDI69882.1 sugar ABC transporter permease [Halopelagius longus]SDR07450.1 carbohydrate ABC transporter membrane protein 1, CUT1 family [Halopelagius longus]
MTNKIQQVVSPIFYKIEQLEEDTYGYLLIAPVFVTLSVLAFYPLARTLFFSLHDDDLTGIDPVGEFVAVENYVQLLNGDLNSILSYPFMDLQNPFSSALFLTVLITVVSVGIGTLLGLGMALILNKEFRGRAYARTIVILPWSVPIVIQGMMFYLLFQPSISFFVEPLANLGLFSANPLVSSRDSTIIVILIDIWRKIPFIALIIMAGLASIDRSLYDVAKVAGATKWQQFRYITLPLVKPVLFIGMIFYTISSMKIYGIVEASAGCGTVPTLTCLVVATFRQQRWPTASAIAFLTALLIGAIVMLYVLRFRESMTNE